MTSYESIDMGPGLFDDFWADDEQDIAKTPGQVIADDITSMFDKRLSGVHGPLSHEATVFEDELLVSYPDLGKEDDHLHDPYIRGLVLDSLISHYIEKSRQNA